jgi:predicted nucleic acid-binding protein
MSEGELKGAVGKFTNEFTKLATLRYLDVVPLYTNIIVDAIKLILEYHVYEADAIQMVSSKDSNCVLFLTADRKLVKVARSIGINAFDVEKEGEKIKDFVESCN